MEEKLKNHIITIFLNDSNKMINENKKCAHHYEAMQSLEPEFSKNGFKFHTKDYEPDNSFGYRFVSLGHILIINLLNDGMGNALGYLFFIPEQYTEEQRRIIANCRELLSYTDLYFFQKQGDSFVECDEQNFIISSFIKKKTK